MADFILASIYVFTLLANDDEFKGLQRKHQ